VRGTRGELFGVVDERVLVLVGVEVLVWGTTKGMDLKRRWTSASVSRSGETSSVLSWAATRRCALGRGCYIHIIK
jgi:hypothetical protein